MFDELKEEEIVRKVGGRYKLATLMQKRVINLMNGARPLVDLRTDNKMAIALAEIMQNKIYLDTSGFVQISADLLPDGGELDDEDIE